VANQLFLSTSPRRRETDSMDINTLNKTFLSGSPFPHIVIDNLFETALIKQIEGEIANFTDWDGEKHFHGSDKKRYCGTLEKLPSTSRNMIQTLNSPTFLKFLEGVTGIPHLIPDPYLEGGGYHSIGTGGFLKIHADFNWHAKLQLHRRINVLLYLNSDWDEAWGGHLELWDPDMTHCAKKVAPIFNRLAVFSTTDTSFHGHPDPLLCPPDVRRKSIALYYYTAERPASEVNRGRSVQTDYRARANEVFAG
jgi:Rps23 Pro-64 3,4-dihydroxylase Tpa1-like proline 4-hydroxylase